MITTIDTSAPVVVRLSTVISAPLERVWSLHTDIDAWPTWQPDITAAALAGPLAPGSVFVWSTAGLEISSTVYAVEPRHRILWGGPAHGITGIHQWTFDEQDGQVHVHTAESWAGDPIQVDPDGMRAALETSLTTWLHHLKSTAEQPS
ncbi:SRPBCC family protein [Nonomuraea sp. NPDC050536]|uniref:SRPBCC family protein n=1 Tax=Nonomuraea sp. NPDC050536 TaxID=3364366 RepID=UPI0037CBDA4E